MLVSDVLIKRCFIGVMVIKARFNTISQQWKVTKCEDMLRYPPLKFCYCGDIGIGWASKATPEYLCSWVVLVTFLDAGTRYLTPKTWRGDLLWITVLGYSVHGFWL